MKIVVVNYANDKYKKVQEKNTQTALKKGKADEVYSYSHRDIDEKFYNANKHILSIKRGNGLWLWKPYFIKKSLEKIEYGDILFYTDSGCYFTDRIDKILNKVDDFQILCFGLPLLEEQFTKKETLKKMQCDNDRFAKSNQIMGTYIIMKKTTLVEKFIDEWLNLCCDYDLISPTTGENENESFISHREDQSIFSLLCKKYNFLPYNDISQLYYFPKIYKEKNFIFKKSKYETKKLPVILFLHRLSEINFITMTKYKIRTFLSIFR